MIQFLRFVPKEDLDTYIPVMEGSQVVKFFIKRTLILVLFIYSTLFLPVALPFVQTPFIPMYFVGGMATMFYLFRYINYFVKFFKYRGGSIRIFKDGIDITDSSKQFRIPASDITYIERNVLGNLIIREKYNKTSFPLTFIDEKQREEIINLFQDMAPKRTNFFKRVWEFIDAIAVALILAVHIIQYVIQAYYIPTGSMEDTLRKGDHLFVEKVTYGPMIPQMAFMDAPIHLDWLGIRDIKRKDIVIFRPPNEVDKDYIKRVVALPGERVEIKDGHVYINGEKLVEPYVKGSTFVMNTHGKGILGVVPEGKVVVFGDNRENSSDGCVFGYLDISKIKGRAFILYWNTEQVFQFDFSRIGLIR